MQNQLTSNRMSGRATGAFFFSGFGALWLVLGLYASEHLTVVTVFLLAAGTSALLAGAIWLLNKSKQLPRAADDPAVSRAFKRINLIQWVAVAVVAFSFAKLGIDAYVLSAITAIVGLHMFPLARLFRYPMHYLIGAALIAWSIASVFLFPEEELQGATALGTGIILWAGAWFTMALAARLLRTHRKTLTALNPLREN